MIGRRIPAPPGLAWPPGRVAGVDVGGSGSAAVLIVDGRVTAEVHGQGGNVTIDPESVDAVAQVVSRWAPDSVGFGVPGLRDPAHAAQVAVRLGSIVGAQVWVGGDQDAAVLGAHGGGAGVVLGAGTGSFAAGWDGRGRWVRAGGHGFVLGDEGSAYWIGRELLGGVLARDDGVIAATAGDATVATAILERLGQPDLNSVVTSVTRNPADRARLASLAEIVDAVRDSSVVLEVIARAETHLLALAIAVRDDLGVSAISLHGGVVTETELGRRLRARLGAVAPKFSAGAGAAMFTTGISLSSAAHG